MNEQELVRPRRERWGSRQRGRPGQEDAGGRTLGDGFREQQAVSSEHCQPVGNQRTWDWRGTQKAP